MHPFHALRGHEVHVCCRDPNPGLGPYNTNQDIPALGAGGETAGIWVQFYGF